MFICSIVILGFMLLISLRLCGVYSPSSLMLAIWLLDFVAQYSFGFYAIELKTVMLLTIFISYFAIGAFFGSSIKFKKSMYEWSENKIYNAIKLIFMLLVVVYPFLYLNIRDNVGFDVDNFALMVRRYYVASSAESVPITIKIVANFSIILVVLSCIYSNMKFFKKAFFIMCGLFGATMAFSKGYLVLMFSYLFSLIIFQKRKAYLYLLAIILSGFLVLILSTVVRDRADIGTNFRIYLLSSVPAFQMIVNDEFHFAFPTILGFMKPVYELFGMNIDIISGDNFVEVPDYTNVFTAFGPAFSDYGVLFTVLYFMANGFISGVIFKLAKLNYMVFKILYGFIIFAIVTSVFSDAFALWSTFFKYLLVFLIIHLYARTKIENRNLAAI